MGAAEAEWSWRPISPGEVEHLEALAEVLRRSRLAAGLTQRRLSDLARGTARRASSRPSERTIQHIEHGERRTRYDTLVRLARALGPRLSREPSELLHDFLRAAGPTLAPDRGRFELSPYLGRRRPFADPVTGEFLGWQGVSKDG